MTSRALRALPVALGLLLCGVGCRRAEPTRPNVVVIVVDTLRADRLGVEGNPRGLTPFLDELAQRGTRFARAYAQSAWTNPSVASLLTSRYPSQHQVRNFDSKLAADEVTFAQRLAQGGWVGGGFSANVQLDGANGYGRGFEHWQRFPETIKLRGGPLGEAALAWLDVTWRPRSGQPLLLYLQYMEPHAPYEPPAAFRERFAAGVTAEEAKRLNDLLLALEWSRLSDADVATLAALYDAEVAAVDAELRRFVGELERRGVLDHALLIVTADHGEEFREHGQLAHGLTLFEPAIHVPLLVIGDGFPAGAVVRRPVALVDVAPAILEAAALPPEPRFEGRSLRALLSPLDVDGEVLSELLSWQEADWRQHAAALVAGTQKLVVPPYHLRTVRTPQVFDLARDPGEQFPNPPGLEVAGMVLHQRLTDLVASLEPRAVHSEDRGGVDAEQRARLRALGYLQ
jgi:arylsulfatase A-like enzyme